MKKLLILLMPLMASCAAVSEEVVEEPKYIEKIARVTYYWPGNGGQVGRITSTGVRAECGKSAAVDPRVIPYHSKIHIPKMGKTLVAVDTGGAVKSRKASRRLGRDNIVIDIFCRNEAEARRRIREYPMFMKIKVEKK
jgi:3D (Asp-Asp-Asp) domain-containing protein